MKTSHFFYLPDEKRQKEERGREEGGERKLIRDRRISANFCRLTNFKSMKTFAQNRRLPPCSHSLHTYHMSYDLFLYFLKASLVAVAVVPFTF